MNIHVDPKYESLLPKIPGMEYKALKESIKTEGLHYPIIINADGVILDGHNRYKICCELGIEPKFQIKDFDDPLVEKKFVIESNLRRRHLNDFQKAELSYPLLEIERELARKRQISKLKPFQNMPQLAPNGANYKSTEIVAKKIGLSTRTFERAVKLIEEAPEELKEKIRRGKVSIGYATQMLIRKEREPPPLPDDVYNLIYADPPWEYDVRLEGSANEHYPTMLTRDICNIRVPSAEDAVLFLWATNPLLKDALDVMEAWGFTYKTNMVWVKDRAGMGYYFRGQHELLMVGVKGNAGPPPEGLRGPSVLEAPVREHSRKPDAAYQIIERMYPGYRYLELFARRRRDGWASWGLDVSSPAVEG